MVNILDGNGNAYRTCCTIKRPSPSPSPQHAYEGDLVDLLGGTLYVSTIPVSGRGAARGRGAAVNGKPLLLHVLKFHETLRVVT